MNKLIEELETAYLNGDKDVSRLAGRAMNHIADLKAAIAQAESPAPVNEKLVEALRPLLAAAVGLSHGVDWNNGTHAKRHGYRQNLLDAIPAAKQVLASLPKTKATDSD